MRLRRFSRLQELCRYCIPPRFRPKSTLHEGKEQQKKLKRKRPQDDGPPSKRGVAATCQTIRLNEREEDDALPETVHVYFDIEATQTDGRHVANLVVAELEYENAKTEIFQGGRCVEEILEWLDSFFSEGRKTLTVVAHNFKGYDSYLYCNITTGRVEK